MNVPQQLFDTLLSSKGWYGRWEEYSKFLEELVKFLEQNRQESANQDVNVQIDGQDYSLSALLAGARNILISLDYGLRVVPDQDGKLLTEIRKALAETKYKFTEESFGERLSRLQQFIDYVNALAAQAASAQAGVQTKRQFIEDALDVNISKNSLKVSQWQELIGNLQKSQKQISQLTLTEDSLDAAIRSEIKRLTPLANTNEILKELLKKYNDAWNDAQRDWQKQVKSEAIITDLKSSWEKHTWLKPLVENIEGLKIKEFTEALFKGIATDERIGKLEEIAEKFFNLTFEPVLSDRENEFNELITLFKEVAQKKETDFKNFVTDTNRSLSLLLGLSQAKQADTTEGGTAEDQKDEEEKQPNIKLEDRWEQRLRGLKQRAEDMDGAPQNLILQQLGIHFAELQLATKPEAEIEELFKEIRDKIKEILPSNPKIADDVIAYITTLLDNFSKQTEPKKPDMATVPGQVRNTLSEEPKTPPVAPANKRSLGEIQHLQVVLVQEAEATVRQALLEDSAFRTTFESHIKTNPAYASLSFEQYVDRVLDQYHNQLSQTVWMGFLQRGGLDAKNDISFSNLATIWVQGSQSVLTDIYTQHALDVQVALQFIAQQRTEASENSLALALGAAGFTDAGEVNNLLRQFADPTQFQALLNEAATLEKQLATIDVQGLQELLKNTSLQTSTILDDGEIILIAKHLQNLQGSPLQAVLEGIQNIPKKDLERLQVLLNKQQTGQLSARENQELTVLFQRSLPTIKLLQTYQRELLALLVAPRELMRFQQNLQRIGNNKRAPAALVPTLAGLRKQVSPYTKGKSATADSDEDTKALSSMEKALLSYTLMAATELNNRKMDEKHLAYFELLTAEISYLGSPIAAEELQKYMHENIFDYKIPDEEELEARRQTLRDRGVSTIGQATEAMQKARQLNALLVTKGNPYAIAALMLTDPNMRAEAQKRIKQILLVGTVSGGVLTGAGIYALLKNYIEVYNAIAKGWNFMMSPYNWLADKTFLPSLKLPIFETGGSSASALPAINGADAAAIAQETASNAAKAANHFAASTQNLALTNADAAYKTVEAGLREMSSLNTSAWIIGGGILAPFGMIGVFTIIVMTVISSSLNDIPINGLGNIPNRPVLGLLNTSDMGCISIDQASFVHPETKKQLSTTKLKEQVVRFMQSPYARKMCDFTGPILLKSGPASGGWGQHMGRGVIQVGEPWRTSSLGAGVFTLAHEMTHALQASSDVYDIQGKSPGGIPTIPTYGVDMCHRFNMPKENQAEAFGLTLYSDIFSARNPYASDPGCPGSGLSDISKYDIRVSQPEVVNFVHQFLSP